MVSFKGQKKLGPRPDWSPLGPFRVFKPLKFPTSIPVPFIWESSPGGNERINQKRENERNQQP